MRREIIAALAVFAASASFAQMPPNAFITRHVSSTNALVRHVQENPVVMDRYCRHFQMNPQEVTNMLRGLHVETLSEDGTYEVFNVPGTGELRSKRMVRKKGERVFADANGTPVIRMNCGNPLTRMDEADSKNPSLAVSRPIDITSIEVPKGSALISNVSLMQPAAPVAPEVTFETPTVETNTKTSGGAPFVGIGLGLLPAVFVGLNTGSNPVPEPSTIAALGIGCALLFASARRRTR
jgi:hypothetical protein